MAQDWLLGIEIGGTKLQLGLGRADGDLSILERRRIDPSKGASGILDQIREAFGIILERASLSRSQVRRVGVGFGGPVDADRGRIQASYQVEGWTDFPLADWLRENLGIPGVVIQNDADTAGLAEARFGAGKGCSPLLYLTIGSGIGGALIIDGRIYRGAGLGAAEIGHLEVPDLTTPFQTRQLEQVASGWAIASTARQFARELVNDGRRDWLVLDYAEGNPETITTEMVAQGVREGDPRSCQILEQARNALAFALCQAVALLAPRRIILGGGVSLIGPDLWFNPIRKRVDAGVFPLFRGSFDIMPAKLGETVVVHGALALAEDAPSPLK